MKMLINGRPTDASDGRVIEVCNSYTQERIDTVPNATKADIDSALAAAAEGKRIWAATPLYKRAEILMRYYALLLAHKDEIAKLQTAETGKLIGDSLGDVEYTADQFKGYTELALHRQGGVLPNDARPGLDKDFLLTVHEPIGTIVCIIPFNYPIDLFAHKVAPALAAGNAVIVKPASDSPLAVIRCTELLIEAGVPGSVAQVVTGSGATVGDYLTDSPLADAVSLTGSVESGCAVAANAAKHLKRAFLELGGNDAMIVFEDADLDVAVESVVGGRIANAGQICCGTKRYIVHASVHDAFVERLKARLDKVVVGDPADPATQMGCLVSVKAAKAVEEQIAHTVGQGATCVYGGKRVHESTITPTVLTGVTPDMDVATDMEIFGPVIPIMTFTSFDEAIRLANATKFGLQNCVISQSISTCMKAAMALESGGVILNGPSSFRSPDAPFGGHKSSGIGVEGMSDTLNEMSVLKTIVIKNALA